MNMSYERSIFRTGEYVGAFRPDDRDNPFRAIYGRKRADVLRLAESVLGANAAAEVLDIGGGMGRVAVPLAQRYHVCLGDISPAMLDLARQAAVEAKLPEDALTTSVVDASQPLPFADARFDLIVCLDLLVHLPDPQAAVREMCRIVKPGGTLLIDATNSVPVWIFGYPRYAGKSPARWMGTLRHGGVLPEWANIVHHTRHETFIGWLRAAGIEVVGERRYGPLPGVAKWFLAIGRKPL